MAASKMGAKIVGCAGAEQANPAWNAAAASFRAWAKERGGRFPYEKRPAFRGLTRVRALGMMSGLKGALARDTKEDAIMAEFLEAMMVISFGASWPMDIYKAYKARTARGTSLPFLCCLEFGYLCGIGWKVLTGDLQAFFRGEWSNYGCFFYLLNAAMVLTAIFIYFRNRNLDRRRAQAGPELIPR